MKISSKKLADLHEYFTNGGSTDPEDVAAQLETEDEAYVEAYVNSLKRRYPDVYGDSGDGEGQEVTQQYFLIDLESGLTKELNCVREKGSKRYFETIEPKDLVTIRVGGEEIEVDLIKLRKKAPTDRMGNYAVSTLILAAELAKG
jgi:hypothetical protein